MEDAAVEAYFARLSLPTRLLARELDRIVVGALPEARRTIKYGVPFYVLRAPACYLSASKDRALLGFLRGAEIPDASGRLSGTGKSAIRRAEFRLEEPVPVALVRRWLAAARRLDARA